MQQAPSHRFRHLFNPSYYFGSGVEETQFFERQADQRVPIDEFVHEIARQVPELGLSQEEQEARIGRIREYLPQRPAAHIYIFQGIGRDGVKNISWNHLSAGIASMTFQTFHDGTIDSVTLFGPQVGRERPRQIEGLRFSNGSYQAFRSLPATEAMPQLGSGIRLIHRAYDTPFEEIEHAN